MTVSVRLWAPVLLASAFLTAPGLAAASIRVMVSEAAEHYEITGDTAEALFSEMQRKGPPSSFGGQRYFAATRVDVSTSFIFDQSERSCAIERGDLFVDVTIVTPRWADRSRASAGLADYWNEFERRLYAHERGHLEIAERAARKLAREIESVGPKSACAGVLREVKALTERILNREAAAEQRAYDSTTEHGRTQGAWFDVDAVRGDRASR